MMAAAVDNSGSTQPAANWPTSESGGGLEDAAAGLTSWVQYWQGPSEAADSAGETSDAPHKSQLPPIGSANFSPEREKAIAVIKEAQESDGVTALVDKLATVIEDKESMAKEAAKRASEVKELREQLEQAQAQLAEAKKVVTVTSNSRLGSRPLSSHSRASIGQRPHSQTEISTHSLLERCLSSASHQSSRSRLESSLDDIDEALNLIQQNAGNPDKAVRSLLNATRDQVKFALGELDAIVTHDDNLEKQYKEAVVINSQLERDLDRTRREMRHLKGKLSISELTPLAMRQEKARQRDLASTRRKIANDMQRSHAKAEAQLSPIRTARERSQTVNARGEYLDTRRNSARSLWQQQTLDKTPTRPGHRRSISEPLPPPLVGCRCSVCRSVQSLGATTANHIRGNLASHANQREIQQIVLGDRVTLKGGRKGIVKYIGRLHSEAAGLTIFIGLHLDQPVGRHSGTLDGRRYFSCPPNHGLFITVSDIMDVAGKAVPLGASLPASRGHGTRRSTRSVSRKHDTRDGQLQLGLKRQAKKHPPGFESANFSDTWPPGRAKEEKKQDETTGTKLPAISDTEHSLTASKLNNTSQMVRSHVSQRTAEGAASKQSGMTNVTGRTAEGAASKQSGATNVTARTAATSSSKQVQTEQMEEHSTKKSGDGVSEEDVDNLSQRLSALIDRGRREEGRIRASQVMKAGVDYYTVEEYLRDLFLLADYDRSGLVSSDDFLKLLLSQALHLHLTKPQQDLLLEKLKHMPDGRIPYAASVPHLGLVLQEVKVETRSAPSIEDWCNFYSEAVNEVVYWNVRTGDVTCDLPDGINVEELAQEMSEDKLDVEMAILTAMFKTMQDKDLGSSGFLTPREFSLVLQSDAFPVKLSPAEAEQVLFQCGADLNIDMGIPYLNNIPAIRTFISQVQSAGVPPAKDESEENHFGWTQAFCSSFGVYYLHKRSATAQYQRPPHCIP